MELEKTLDFCYTHIRAVKIYLYAFEQITTPRYCSYAASLTYTLQYMWYKYEI